MIAVTRRARHDGTTPARPESGKCGAELEVGLEARTSDRRWEQGEDISILDAFTLEYRPNETEHLTIDPDLRIKICEWPIRPLASTAGVSTRTVKAAREGKRLRQSTIEKL